MISWLSREQTSVTLSTVEAKYIAASIERCEVVWIQKFLARIHLIHDAKGSCEAPVHIH